MAFFCWLSDVIDELSCRSVGPLLMATGGGEHLAVTQRALSTAFVCIEEQSFDQSWLMWPPIAAREAHGAGLTSETEEGEDGCQAAAVSHSGGLCVRLSPPRLLVEVRTCLSYVVASPCGLVPSTVPDVKYRPRKRCHHIELCTGFWV